MPDGIGFWTWNFFVKHKEGVWGNLLSFVHKSQLYVPLLGLPAIAVSALIEEIKRLKDRLHDENVALREQIDQVFMFEEIVGSSPALKTVLSGIVKVAPTDSTVLITGETGTGKELIARERISARLIKLR